MSGRLMSMSMSVPTPGTKCVHTLLLVSAATNNITTMLEYLRCRDLETAHNKSTTSCTEWDNHYNTHAQTHVQINLLHHPHIVKPVDRPQREATVAKSLQTSVMSCIHNDSTRNCVARNQHTN